MQKYDGIMKERPNKNQPDITLATTRVSRDEDEIMLDAKNKLRIVLSSGSAPVFPTGANVSGSGGKRYKTSHNVYYRSKFATAKVSNHVNLLPQLLFLLGNSFLFICLGRKQAELYWNI